MGREKPNMECKNCECWINPSAMNFCFKTARHGKPKRRTILYTNAKNRVGSWHTPKFTLPSHWCSMYGSTCTICFDGGRKFPKTSYDQNTRKHLTAAETAAHQLQYLMRNGEYLKFSTYDLATYFNVDHQQILMLAASKLLPTIKSGAKYTGPSIANWLLSAPKYKKPHSKSLDISSTSKMYDVRLALLTQMLADTEKVLKELKSAIEGNKNVSYN